MHMSKFLSVLVLVIAVFVAAQEEDAYYGYEEGYYETEVDASGGATTTQQVNNNNNAAKDTFFEPPQRKKGFSRREASVGAPLRMLRTLATKQYINATAELYGCALRDVAIIPRNNVTANATLESQDPLERLKVLSDMAEGIFPGAGQSDDTNTTEPVPDKVDKTPKRKPSFREIQEEKLRKRLELKARLEAEKPKFLLGADCETQICGACKIVVEEFSYAVARAVNDPSILYVDQVFEGFCDTKEINVKYDDIVYSICSKFQEKPLGYYDNLITTFEKDTNYDKLKTYQSIYAKQKSVCLAIGACDNSQFEFSTIPKYKQQDQWNETCYVCQAFAKNTEERVQLTRYVTEASIVPIVGATCDRLQLPNEFDSICRQLSKGKMLDDISWIAKVHDESVQKKQKAELRFPDKLCEEIKYCKKWIDPELQEMMAMEEEQEEAMEEVFY